MHETDLIWRLVLALVLSSVIGAEREIRQKSAGLRTYALVGTGSCLFMLVSEYGFQGGGFGANVTLDPSRVAAQIVSGIGFIGGGLIFVHRKSVRGLTTAAGVWVTAAVGMAAGGNLPLLATLTTVLYLLVSYGYPLITDRLPASRRAPSEMLLTYRDGEGILRKLLEDCAEHGFAVSDLHVERTSHRGDNGERAVTVRLELRGKGSIPELAADLHARDGVLDVSAGDVDDYQEA
jgi:putative Mg2+ transporter-C (MgtC) family protein